MIRPHDSHALASSHHIVGIRMWVSRLTPLAAVWWTRMGAVATLAMGFCVFCDYAPRHTVIAQSQAPHRTQNAGAMRNNSVYDVLRGRSPKANTQEAIQPLIDEIFAQTGFKETAPSLRLRLGRAELAYRQGRHSGIQIGRLVSATNSLAKTLAMPNYFETSVSQIRLHRLFAQMHVPDGLWDGSIDNDSVSPSQAMFTVLFLLQQKMFNATYQVDPETWSRRQEALLRNKPNPQFLKARARVLPRKVHIAEYRYLHARLADDASDAVYEAHRFLDRLGVAR